MRKWKKKISNIDNFFLLKMINEIIVIEIIINLFTVGIVPTPMPVVIGVATTHGKENLLLKSIYPYNTGMVPLLSESW